jgi:hypothetical protein
MQEIRVPCTEDTLLAAMGLTISLPVEEGGGHSPFRHKQQQDMAQIVPIPVESAGDPKLLARTWLHDEGHISEVVELARFLPSLLTMQGTFSFSTSLY